MAISVLIIEDQEELLDLLQVILKRVGYKVFAYDNGEDALKNIESILPDIILLDLMLPGKNGYEICKEIKEYKNPKIPEIPIIMLTAKNEDYDEIIGFQVGCADYITKPFNEEILIARIRASLKKSGISKDNSLIRLNELILDTKNLTTKIGCKPINLTPYEFKLLSYLAENKDKLLSRNNIYDYMHDHDDEYVDEKSITILMTRIRKKLGKYGKAIESVYGVGYRLNSNLEEVLKN